MTVSSSMSPRLVWLMIWGALSMAPVIYAVVAQVLPMPAQAPPTLGMIRLVFVAMSGLGFVAGAFIMSRAAVPAGWPPVPPTSGGPEMAWNSAELVPPAVFQSRTIVAMAFFESVAIYGFVLTTMGAPHTQILPWCAASLAGLLGIALPNGLSYWRRWEQASTGARPAPLG